MTLYLDYHPGGREKLMLGAGKDCTQLYSKNGFINFRLISRLGQWTCLLRKRPSRISEKMNYTS